MSETLEQKILGAVIGNHELLNRAELKPEWFSYQKYRELAHTLKDIEKFDDISELISRHKEIYPKSTLSEDVLRAIEVQQFLVKDYRASVKALERDYYQRKLEDASREFSEYPSEKNRQKLQKLLRESEEVDLDEDDGDLKEPVERLFYELEHELEDGIKTYPRFDKVLGGGLRGGRLYVIAARPGVGKSAFALNLVYEALLRDADLQIDFFSLEMSKLDMLKRFVGRGTGINTYKFNNAALALNDEEKRQVVERANWAYSTGLKVYDKHNRLSEIENTIRQRKHDHPDDNYIAIVDYLQLMDAEDHYLQRHQQVGKISRRLKQLTLELDIPIIAISQLNRAVDGRDSPIPYLSDLRESGDIEQDANSIIFLSNDEEENESRENGETEPYVNITIAKNREGATGNILYVFEKAKMYFAEVDYG